MWNACELNKKNFKKNFEHCSVRIYIILTMSELGVLADLNNQGFKASVHESLYEKLHVSFLPVWDSWQSLFDFSQLFHIFILQKEINQQRSFRLHSGYDNKLHCAMGLCLLNTCQSKIHDYTVLRCGCNWWLACSMIETVTTTEWLVMNRKQISKTCFPCLLL